MASTRKVVGWFLMCLLVIVFLGGNVRIARAESLPDLALPNISFNNQGVPTVTVKNNGSANVSASLSSGTSVKLKWGWGNLDSERDIGTSLAPGATKQITFNAWYTGSRLLRIKVDDPNNVRESNESNNYREAVAPLPDLIVEDITFNQDTGIPTMNVKNIGTVIARPSYQSIQLYYGFKNAQGSSVGGGFQTKDIGTSLAAGATVSITGEAPPSDATTFVARVDQPSYRVQESNENNNERIEQVPRPDLALPEVTFDNDGVPTVAVKNQGSVNMSVGLTSGQVVSLKFGWGDLNNGRDVGTSLAPGATKPIRLVPRSSNSTSLLRIKVDEPDRVKESNESNNFREVPAPLPDLIVETIAFNESTGIPTVTVKNRNSVAARTSDALKIEYRWKKGENTIGSPKAEVLSVNHLAAGATAQHSIEEAAPSGATHIVVKVDAPYSRIQEWNENNNEKTEPVLIPDLIIESISFDTDGRPIATVKNRGNATAQLGSYETTTMQYRWGSSGANRSAYMGGGTLVKDATRHVTLSSRPGTEPPTLWAKADEPSKINESDENNNTRTASVPLPDLIIESITFNETSGAPTVAVKNTANTIARIVNDSLQVEYWWKNSSGNTIGSHKTKDVASSINATATVLVSLTDTPPLGARSFVAKIDAPYSHLLENNENNNQAEEPLSLPDLTIESITFATDGTPIVKVKNTGTATANLGAFDSVLMKYGWGSSMADANRTSYMGGGSLAPGATKDIRLSPRSGNDPVLLFVKVDEPDRINEANENNNTRSITSSLPDLIVESVTINQGIPTMTVKNIGNVSARSPFNPIEIYFGFKNKAGNTVGGGFKKKDIGTSLAAGATVQVVGDVVSSDATTFIARIDQPSYRIRESNENNNEWNGPLPLPDLTIESATIDSISTGVFLNVIVKNIGTASVPLDGRTRWMASFRDAEGKLIVGSSGGGYILDQGGTLGQNQATGETGFELPEVPLTAKTILIVLDDEEKVAESNEGNNEKSIPVTLAKPDLFITAAVVEDGFLNITVKNIGNTPVDGNEVRWLAYFRDDQDKTLKYSGDSTGFGSSLDGTLSPGGSKTSGIQLPAIPPGAKTILIYVDDPSFAAGTDGVINEKDETNNTKQIPVPISTSQLPDLVVTSVTFESSTNTYTVIVKNQGASAADLRPKNDGQYDRYVELTAFWKDAQDKNITSSSYNIQAFGGNSLAPGATISISVAAGTHQATSVLLQIDKDNVVSESNEENNESQHGLFQADLIIDGVVFVSGVSTIYVKNIGGATADLRPKMRDGYDRYVELSVSWEKDGNVMSEGGFSHNLQAVSGDSLAAGGTIHITTPAPPNGATSMKVVVDSDYVLPESNEDNNTWTGLIVISSTTPEGMVKFDEEIVVDAIEDSLAASPSAAVKPPRFFEVIPCIRIRFTENLCEDLSVFFTPDIENKTKLRLKFANEEILEANALSDQGKLDAVQDSLNQYKDDMKDVGELTDKLQQKKPDIVDDIVTKALEDQLRHQLLLEKFERVAPKGSQGDIKAVQTETIKHISETISRITNKNDILEAFDKALDRAGSPLAPVRNTALLIKLGKSVVGIQKDIVESIEEKQREAIGDRFEKLPDKQQELLPEYLKNAGKDNASYTEILLDLEKKQGLYKKPAQQPQGQTPRLPNLPPLPGFSGGSIPNFSSFDEYVTWVRQYVGIDVIEGLSEEEISLLRQQFEQYKQYLNSTGPIEESTQNYQETYEGE